MSRNPYDGRELLDHARRLAEAGEPVEPTPLLAPLGAAVVVPVAAGGDVVEAIRAAHESLDAVLRSMLEREGRPW